MKVRKRGGVAGKRVGVFALALIVCAPAVLARNEELRFKPGYNLFSPQDDIKFGREAAAEVDKELPLVSDTGVNQYVTDLGRRLAGYAPVNSDYPWAFKVVNSQDINAFALPGGFVYVNRGALEAADNEAQIAGVMAHEIGHVVMRHGTHQATNMLMAQLPLAILGGVLGESSSLGGQLAQMGLSFGVNSILLKNSRGAESQADEVGTYVLYHAGYDPHAMAQFFQIIEKKYPQRTIEFFSDHPNPENRIQKVDAIIPRLGSDRGGKTDTPDFQAARKKLLDMPPSPKEKGAPHAAPKPAAPPPAPSARLVTYRAEDFSINHPENWEVQKAEDGVTLAPPGGIFAGPQGEHAQAYGASVTRYSPSSARERKRWDLIDATQRLIDSLRQSNPNLKVIKQTGIKIKGRPALSTLLENDSPMEGQKETDQMVTVRSHGNMLAILFVAPQSSLETYRPTFEAMLRSFQPR